MKPIEELSEDLSFCKTVDIAIIAMIIGIIIVKCILEI